MNHNHPLLARRSRRMREKSRGAALIIVLSFIVLLTLIIVAFLVHSQMGIQIMNARAAQSQVDVMARTAIELTKGDLRQEIIAGSTNNAIYTVNGIPVYIPSTNATIVPSRTGFTPGAAGSDPLDNIVKISKSGSPFFSGSAYNSAYPAANYASAVSTGTPSLNGRHIDNPTTGWTTTGWDKPQLIDITKYGGSALQAPVPDWIYVTTTGRQVLTQPVGNVVGRYAYVIYDEGGLLDINVAGYPSSISSPDARDPYRKGSLALADLTQIPGGITSGMQDNLIAWRNQASTASGAFSSTNYPSANSPSYVKYLFNGSLNRGFNAAYPGDQKFLSRQDLLAYAQANPSILPAQSLAYLGTFTRGLNAPTWTPQTTIASANYPSGFPYPTYAENTSGAYNVDSANCRWPATFTVTRPKLDADVDASSPTVPVETVTFNQGDPVLAHRFPLSKIALLSNPAAQTGVITAPAAGDTTGSVAWAVYYYFGLQWVTSDGTLAEPHWVYAHGNSGTLANALTIASIPDAAAKKREPDFFEILRQGVLRGSAQDLMIFDMAASIIDQFDADDLPTAITDGGSGPAREAFGKENLPYFSQMLVWPYRPTEDPTRTRFEGYLIPMFWNPHRNASTPSSTITQFQMILSPATGNSIVMSLNKPAPTGVPTSGLNAAATLQFQTSSTSTYQEPTILKGVPSVPAGGEGASELTDRSGFYLGFVNQADVNVAKALGGSGTGLQAWQKATVLATGGNTCVLQCFSGGTWHTYENLSAFAASSGTWATLETSGANGVSAAPSFSGLAAGASATTYGAISEGPIDPRVSAGATVGGASGGSGGIGHIAVWNTSLGAPPYTGGTWQSVAPESASNGTLELGTISSQFGVFPQVSNSSILTVPASNNLYVGMWNENQSGGSYPNYLDYDTMWTLMMGDYVSRPGDGVYGANPMAADSVSSNPTGHSRDRPIILNRPFRSVAELGYAYRGVEWRTIDFCSTVSGDAGLLDLCSIGDSQKLTALTSTTSASTALASGVVNINTRHPEVLQSLLSGSLKNDLDTTAASVISGSQASAIGSAIVAETSSTASGHGPLINRSELVTRVMGLTQVTGQLTGTVSKPEREAVVRALAEPADTRTWNLLVDLVVQVGHYPASVVQSGNASDLSKFAVQGERRYWLHVAIDRYTGKVIDEQLEVVSDN